MFLDRGLEAVGRGAGLFKGATRGAVRQVQRRQEKVLGAGLPLLVLQGVGFRRFAEKFDDAYVGELPLIWNGGSA
ncbi:hypothetical protein [Brevundimonas diminuta]|uniref:hypothetical protein n=1 Tax=Brevundimonas diminuta TaxID=293 RepID=UPI0028ACD52C|nr:hypothetical protein [Brevundimonas diminuta]